MRSKQKSAQLDLGLPRPKRKRRSRAGRKRAAGSRDPVHRARPAVRACEPVHTVLRVKQCVGRLRRGKVLQAIRHALTVLHSREADFRVVHVSIQHNHLHFLVEAKHAPALSAGMQVLAAAAAKAINRLTGHRGKVFEYRFHSTVIRSPRQTRCALAYVLGNWRRHREDERSLASRFALVDPYSSAPTFTGWNLPVDVPSWPGWECYEPLPVSAARTWLLREGWRKHGPTLDVWSTPGPLE